MLTELRAMGGSIWQHARFARFRAEALIMAATPPSVAPRALPGRP
jgi:hypothetical protein